MSDGFTTAPGHQRGMSVLLNGLKAQIRLRACAEYYAVATDSYYANYKTHRKKGSKINESINEEYIPVVGGLVEATKVGRDEPDVFYKMLAKKTDQYSSAFHGNTHDIGCTMLFVRTDKKQLYKRVFKLKMKVSPEYYDIVHKIKKGQPES